MAVVEDAGVGGRTSVRTNRNDGPLRAVGSGKEQREYWMADWLDKKSWI